MKSFVVCNRTILPSSAYLDLACPTFRDFKLLVNPWHPNFRAPPLAAGILSSYI